MVTKSPGEFRRIHDHIVSSSLAESIRFGKVINPSDHPFRIWSKRDDNGEPIIEVRSDDGKNIELEIEYA